jgi:beta-phosphoglucomutase-like phosphatase (HAD superfamily)
MKKKLKAVLFDMDGVLFNSMPYHSEAWHKVMKSHGLTLSRLYARRTDRGCHY